MNKIYYFKYLETDECWKLVKALLDKLKLHYKDRIKNSVVILDKMDAKKREQLRKGLDKIDYELISDEETALVEKLKRVVEDFVINNKETKENTLDVHLKRELDNSNETLASVFLYVTGITIIRYHVTIKIKKGVKLIYNKGIPVADVADMLHYSHVSNFSTQCMCETGHRPSYYQKLSKKRKARKRI